MIHTPYICKKEGRTYKSSHTCQGAAFFNRTMMGTLSFFLLACHASLVLCQDRIHTNSLKDSMKDSDFSSIKKNSDIFDHKNSKDILKQSEIIRKKYKLKKTKHDYLNKINPIFLDASRLKRQSKVPITSFFGRNANSINPHVDSISLLSSDGFSRKFADFHSPTKKVNALENEIKPVPNSNRLVSQETALEPDSLSSFSTISADTLSDANLINSLMSDPLFIEALKSSMNSSPPKKLGKSLSTDAVTSSNNAIAKPSKSSISDSTSNDNVAQTLSDDELQAFVNLLISNELSPSTERSLNFNHLENTRKEKTSESRRQDTQVNLLTDNLLSNTSPLQTQKTLENPSSLGIPVPNLTESITANDIASIMSLLFSNSNSNINPDLLNQVLGVSIPAQNNSHIINNPIIGNNINQLPSLTADENAILTQFLGIGQGNSADNNLLSNLLGISLPTPNPAKINKEKNAPKLAKSTLNDNLINVISGRSVASGQPQIQFNNNEKLPMIPTTNGIPLPMSIINALVANSIANPNGNPIVNISGMLGIALPETYDQSLSIAQNVAKFGITLPPVENVSNPQFGVTLAPVGGTANNNQANNPNFSGVQPFGITLPKNNNQNTEKSISANLGIAEPTVIGDVSNSLGTNQSFGVNLPKDSAANTGIPIPNTATNSLKSPTQSGQNTIDLNALASSLGVPVPSISDMTIGDLLTKINGTNGIQVLPASQLDTLRNTGVQIPSILSTVSNTAGIEKQINTSSPPPTTVAPATTTTRKPARRRRPGRRRTTQRPPNHLRTSLSDILFAKGEWFGALIGGFIDMGISVMNGLRQPENLT